MKTNEMVFEDQQFIEKTKLQIEETRKAMQNMVNAFNSLGFEKLKPNELEPLVKNPKRIFDQKLNSSIEAPAGLIKEKYLELVQKPDLAPVIAARDSLMKNQYCMSFEFFRLAGESVELVTDSYTALLESQNLYYPKGSKELKIALEVVQAVENFNRLNEITGFALVSGHSNGFNEYFDKKQVTNFGYILVIDRYKLSKLVSLAVSRINCKLQ